MKMLYLFLMPSSAWGMFAGTTAGLSFSVLIIISQLNGDESQAADYWWSFVLLLLSSACFATISIKIEQARAETDIKDYLTDLSHSKLGATLLVIFAIAMLALSFGMRILF